MDDVKITGIWATVIVVVAFGIGYLIYNDSIVNQNNITNCTTNGASWIQGNCIN